MPRRPKALLATVALVLAAGACGGEDGGTAPEVPATAELLAGEGQTGEVGSALAQTLSVRVTSNRDNPSTGVTVTWTVVSGGGSLTTQDATGSDGIATASWTLGATVGQQQVRATASGLTPVTFTATATAGPPESVTLTQTELLIQGIGETGELGPVTVEDASGNELDPSVVSFSSDDEGVATVDADGTVTAVGVGITTVTATAGTVSAEASVEVQLASLTPENDVTISGTFAYTEVAIPAGVTVTITGASTLDVSGATTVDGILTADCHALTVNSGGDLAVTGTVSNACSSEAGDPEDLTLTAVGSITLTGALIRSDGNVSITNTSGGGPSALRAAGFSPMLDVPARAGEGTDCWVQETDFRPLIITNSLTISPGDDGGDFALECAGALTITEFTVATQHGIEGSGQPDDESGDQADGEGGPGGNGGGIRIAANTITFTTGNSPSIISTGNGGGGGLWHSSGGAPTATGGAGGHPGVVRFETTLTATVQIDALAIHAGDAGDGGAATAVGGTGSDATAVGGAGGDIGEDGDHAFIGNWSDVGNVDLSQSGEAGDGGLVHVVPGDGLPGTTPAESGGTGGAVNATSGSGGNVWTLLRQGGSTYLGNPGNAGGGLFVGGGGGTGFGTCAIDRTEAEEDGGVGGAGGAFNFTPGTRGSAGPSQGIYLPIVVRDYGNGGRGGAGNFYGAGGAPSVVDIPALEAQGITVVQENDNFQTGQPGRFCGEVNDVVLETIAGEEHDPFSLFGSITVTGVITQPIDANPNEGQLSIVGFDGVWVDIHGPLVTGGQDIGQFTASGTGSVAGFPDILLIATGTLILDENNEQDGFTAEVTVGAGGGLPGGFPQVLLMTGTSAAPPPQAPAPAFGPEAVGGRAPAGNDQVGASWPPPSPPSPENGPASPAWVASWNPNPERRERRARRCGT